MSNTGVIVGAYRDALGHRTHGFILKQGFFETVDAPYELNTLLVSASRKSDRLFAGSIDCSTRREHVFQRTAPSPGSPTFVV